MLTAMHSFTSAVTGLVAILYLVNIANASPIAINHHDITGVGNRAVNKRTPTFEVATDYANFDHSKSALSNQKRDSPGVVDPVHLHPPKKGYCCQSGCVFCWDHHECFLEFGWNQKNKPQVCFICL